MISQSHRNTYENEEEAAVRSGPEPGIRHDSPTADSAVGDDEEESGPGLAPGQSEEARSWSDPGSQYHAPDESNPKFEGLDDGNVWTSK